MEFPSRGICCFSALLPETFQAELPCASLLHSTRKVPSRGVHWFSALLQLGNSWAEILLSSGKRSSSSKTYSRDSFGRGNPGGWFPLPGWKKAAQNWTGTTLTWGFLGLSFSREISQHEKWSDFNPWNWRNSEIGWILSSVTVDFVLRDWLVSCSLGQG